MISNSSYIHDRPAAQDTLGRAHFADILSQSLVLPAGSPGLVVGIEGNWGSGKSTLIGFIKAHLEEPVAGSLPIVVDFNPWMVSNTGALVEALIGQIASSIGKDLSAGEKRIKAGQKLISYVGLLTNLKYLKYVPALGWAGNLAESIPGFIQMVARTAQEGERAGKNALEDFKKLLPSLDLPQQRKEVVEALAELDRPIVVVIDDLDRLPAEEIRIMIGAIKAVADFPRITYLLAYDRSIISRALAEDEESGISYLEKIVQVAYPIPPLSQQQLKKFADGKVHALLNELNIALRDYEQERYGEAIVLLAKLARHPRDIVRIINRLILSLRATHGEVNAADVIVFEALSQRFPALREAMHSCSADFTGQPSRGDLIDENGHIDWREYGGGLGSKYVVKEPWLKHLPRDGHDRSISEKACLFLFPTQEKDGTRANYEDSLRIADPDRLARVFRMTSIEEVPEAKEIHELLMQPEKLKDALSMENKEELSSFLGWVINYIPSCPTPNVKECIDKFIEISQELASEDELIFEMVSKVANAIMGLLRRKTPDCNECFWRITKNASLSISERIILTAARDQGKWKTQTGNILSEDRQLISDGDLVNRAIEAWTERVRQRDAQGSLYKEANLHSVLYRYAQFNNDFRGTYSVISRICETDEGLAAFLKYYKKDSIVDVGMFSLLEDAQKIVQQITSSTLSGEYRWLSDLLIEKETIDLIGRQAAKLKEEF